MQRFIIVFIIFFIKLNLLYSSDFELVLSTKTVISKGVNKFNKDHLEVVKGRGSNISWYIQAREMDSLEVYIEYSNSHPLNQRYQFSFDQHDFFWDVPVTEGSKWHKVSVGSFKVKANYPTLLCIAPPSNKQYKHPVRIKSLILKGSKKNNLILLPHKKSFIMPKSSPGFGEELDALHPVLAVDDYSPEGTQWGVTGIAHKGENEFFITTLKGDVWKISKESNVTNKILIAKGLNAPMGIGLYKGRIFVLERDQVTELTGRNSNGFFEKHVCVSKDWPKSKDYHEYLFGGSILKDEVYFVSSVAMGNRNGDNRQVPLRGSAYKFNFETGEKKLIAAGFREPNGMSIGPDQQIFISDNQGEWLPSSKIIHLQDKAFYNFKYLPVHPLEKSAIIPPAIWIPYGEAGKSPSQPLFLSEAWEQYAGHGIIGDVAFGGLRRFVLEKVNGIYQGVILRWTQGLDFKVNRLEKISDNSILAGRLARGNNWDKNPSHSSLKKITYKGGTAFEILSIRAKSNGFEINFTEPLKPGVGWDVDAFHVEKWNYQATQLYGGMKVRHERVLIKSSSVSADRRTLFLEMENLEKGFVVYFRLSEMIKSVSNRKLWAGEAWYTLNELPKNDLGIVLQAPKNINKIATSLTYQSKISGRVLYQQYCSACHSKTVQKLVGPSFHPSCGLKRTIVDQLGKKKKMVNFDRAYIEQSILDPNSQIVEGFPANLMPSFGSVLNSEQIKALVDFIVQSSKNPSVDK